MKKRMYLSFLFIAVLLMNNFFTYQTFAESNTPPVDTTRPVLLDLSLSKAELHGDDTLILSARAADDISGVNHLYVEYLPPGNIEAKSAFLYDNDNDGLFTGSITTGKYDPNGVYKISYIIVADNQSNSYQYVHSTVSTKKFTTFEYKDLSSYNFTVSNPDADTTFPMLHEVTISRTEGMAGDILTVNAHITDDISGVHYASIGFRGPYDPNYVVGIELLDRDGDGTFTGSHLFRKGDFTGTYTVKGIGVLDNAGNGGQYVNSKDPDDGSPYYENRDLSAYSFTLKSGISPNIDITPPVLEEISLSGGKVHPGENITISATITDDLTGVDFLSIKYRTIDYLNGGDYYKIISLTDNDGDGVFTGKINPGMSDPAGLYQATSIEFGDIQGNNYSYYHSTTATGNATPVIEFKNLSAYNFIFANSNEPGSPHGPVTSISVDHVVNSNGWFNTPIQIVLSALDDTSSTIMTQYRINGEEWMSYNTAIVFEEDGVFNLEYRSTDEFGNTEAIKSASIKIDTAMPETKIVGVKDGESYQNCACVTFQSSDAISGVDKIEYRINQGPWKIYPMYARMSFKNGTYLIGYRSVDKAGNIESSQSVTFHIDRTSSGD
ncbi:OmpL47-type beta-barrel domain-containing protein [Paenibacillus sacheonensis]|uniref:Ig-like domain-containing protein n=1 Tax=Paenibacillus sacheonensis TaxID=742054 RepID=A0A7X4YRM0_9BACL|nr:hypothetical protein [Paenibacillus sacheonensis]MBM7564922.1 hypothetical protein [Paenibacillus sacheonensis]NBC70289.1 hypothetical protein [Paenibacillus sacheonensis]